MNLMRHLYWMLGSAVALVSVLGAIALAVPIAFPASPPAFLGTTALFTPTVDLPNGVEAATCDAVNASGAERDVEVSIIEAATGSVLTTRSCPHLPASIACRAGVHPELPQGALGAVYCRISVVLAPREAVRGSVIAYNFERSEVVALPAQ